MDIITSAPLILATAALTTSIIAIFKINKDKKDYIVETHNMFQRRFREIQTKFPTEVNDESDGINKGKIYNPNDKAQIRNIEHYWYFVFDEWYVCNKLDKRLIVLWQETYIHGVASALKIPGFKLCLENMFKRDISLFKSKDEFKKEIERIDNEINNKN